MSDGKNLLVTGASSDVGAELIRNVGENYGKIWAHYRSSSGIIEELRDQIGKQIVPIQADFSNLESTVNFIEQICASGDIPDHIVHLSALKAHNLQFHKHTWENYQKEIDTSLRSITMILQCFVPRMAKKKYGKIIFMLSAYLLGVPPKFQSPYITVKYALLGLMKNLSAEYAAKGIMVNAVSPDMMETKFLSELPDLIIEQSAKNNPLGRNIYVQEVIPTMEYLLSEGSNIVTGQNIGVTGGSEII
ncbi:MAG: SDR family oxidoreductase [Dorea sp.]|jgi:3-oxoacyl-[acyl-carrier protein] reductase|nr:SDR family oxidoreductase [Dorea sp.]